MLTELINFTKSLSEDFKSIGLSPKEGLHVLLKVDDAGNLLSQMDAIEYGYYSKKMDDISQFLKKCMLLQENAWCVNTNKCFDLPTKAIHTCSPIAVAFKKEHLAGGKKFIANNEKGKPQIHERFETYFSKAIELYQTEDHRIENAIKSFSGFLVKGGWEVVLNDIENVRDSKHELLLQKEIQLKEKQKETSDKAEKASIKEELTHLQQEKLDIQPLSESDYILFYLDLPLSIYKATHGKYLEDKLFNTSAYNTEADENGIIYGTNDFQNGYNSNMPFLLHQTATFDITGRISNLDAKMLYEFSNVLPRKSLPNPLPIFIYGEEIKENFIALCKESEERISYREIIETLYQSHEKDFNNYYLLNWANTQNGIVFNDYDFVSKFEYRLSGWNIQNLFNVFKEKVRGEKSQLKHYMPIKTIFELEDRVLKYLIQNKYHKVDYFSDLKKDDYDNRDMSFLSFCKYRKGIYDYVYKSNRHTIRRKEFDELVFNGIKDDLKNNKEYGIKEKLNIWYSLRNHFNKSKKRLDMANKLKDLQDFVAKAAINEADLQNASDEKFAFAAGQLIEYLIDKSETANKSYQLLEPYLQRSRCDELKKTIALDIARYKHAINKNEMRFKNLFSAVETWETDKNMKDLWPELISGIFSKPQFYNLDFPTKKEKKQ